MPALMVVIDGGRLERMHGYLEDVPPAELEAAHGARQIDQELVGIK